MYLTRKVGPKGQVVIPEEIRSRLGIVSGSSVAFDSDGETITLVRQKTARQAMDDFLAVGKMMGPRKAPTVKELKRMFEQEVEERNGLR